MRSPFYINTNDRRVLAVLLSLAAIGLVVYCFVAQPGNSNGGSNSKATAKHAQTQGSKQTNAKATRYYYQGERRHELFPFDPNTADSTQLLRLGLREWQVRNIYRYRASGGVYSRPTDFARLYGLTAKQYRELEPYIRISPDYLPAADVIARNNSYPSASSHVAPAYPSDNNAQQTQRTTTQLATSSTHTASTTRQPSDDPTSQDIIKLRPGERIDLNSADTAALKRVPGIGSYRASAIAYYRQRLGGFVCVEQLAEIENMPPGVQQYFSVSETPAITRVNINKASVNQMANHPYISFYQAKAIADYRRLHGRITQLSQLSLLKGFTPEDLGRMEFYIDF